MQAMWSVYCIYTDPFVCPAAGYVFFIAFFIFYDNLPLRHLSSASGSCCRFMNTSTPVSTGTSLATIRGRGRSCSESTHTHTHTHSFLERISLCVLPLWWFCDAFLSSHYHVLYTITCCAKWWTSPHPCLWTTEPFDDTPFTCSPVSPVTNEPVLPVECYIQVHFFLHISQLKQSWCQLSQLVLNVLLIVLCK